MNGGPASRCHHTVTSLGKKLVLFGGILDGKPLNDVHVFDAASRSWIIPEILGSPPVPRYGHSAVLLGGERILFFGGHGILPQEIAWFLEVDTPYVKKKSQLLGKTVVAWTKVIFCNLPRPIVMCGPSGVGKGTLIARLKKEFPAMFGVSVSHTTRQPRHLEVDGVDYHFTDRTWMETAIREGKFLESADVHGNLYGTSVAAVEAVASAGKRCILEIDVQGAQAIQRSGLDAIFVFIAPPSIEQLESQLRGRGTESEQQIQKRLQTARVELQHGNDRLLFDHYVVNDNLEECYSEIKKLLGLKCVDSDGMQNGFNDQAMLKPRYNHSAAVSGENVFIFGGESGTGVEDAITIIDTSNIVGGAPGRTMGLRIFSIESQYEMANRCPMNSNSLEIHKENGRL